MMSTDDVLSFGDYRSSEIACRFMPPQTGQATRCGLLPVCGDFMNRLEAHAAPRAEFIVSDDAEMEALA